MGSLCLTISTNETHDRCTDGRLAGPIRPDNGNQWSKLRHGRAARAPEVRNTP